VWWKLQDTVGPATEYQLRQTDDFYDIDSIQEVLTDSALFQQLLFHYFDNIDPVFALLGQVNTLQELFALPQLWNATSAISGRPPPGTEQQQ